MIVGKQGDVFPDGKRWSSPVDTINISGALFDANYTRINIKAKIPNNLWISITSKV